jgi:Domain of unknown function (DUF4149)
VETLYVDLLQFLYHLALAVIVGGGFVLGSVVAPALFRTAPRSEAGTLFAAALARWDGLAIFSVVVVVLTSVLKAGAFEVNEAPEPRLIARWVALFLVACAVIYGSGWAGPVARSIRAQTRDFDDLPPSAPARGEFAKLHRASSRALRIAVIAGLVAMYLS